MECVNPKNLPAPKGYNNGVKVGNLLFIAGQPAYGREPKVEGKDIVAQFDRALSNVLEVVKAAGGKPEQVVQMHLFVKDIKGYKARAKELGAAWRRHFGKHYPAMACVEVRDLFDDGALVEISAIAVLA